MFQGSHSLWSGGRAASLDKQLLPAVYPIAGASASFHYALVARWTAQRAAAELRRYAACVRPAALKATHL